MAEIPLEKELVRHAYDNVIERCARLNSYSGSLVRDLISEEIIAREKSLAIDDIITLSISARRLIAVCGITPNRSELRVQSWRFHLTDDEVSPTPTNTYIGLQKLFGIFIHSEKLDIIDSDLMARLFFDSRDGTEIIVLYSAKVLEEKYFSPKILVESDRSDPYVFDIGEIVSCIDKKLLPAVIDVTERHGLYLESDFPS